MHPLNLFILKKFYDYEGTRQVSNGLKTSALFVVDMLLAEGSRAKLVEAIDGNCIDRLVTQEKPVRVVLEAIWVTPGKMKELMRLHPKIKWTVRVHSEIPFLANEGVAVEWIAEYLKLGVDVGFNSAQTMADFSVIGKAAYLPNVYPLRKPRPHFPHHTHVHVGCFGAIRPLKNQLIQAFAAIKFAREIGKPLVFHMNGARIEQSGSNNLKNIVAVMAATGSRLILHPWMPHAEFLELVAEMNICLQVSLTESFNVTASDAVSMGVPLVGSPAIHWLPRRSQAKVDSAESICAGMHRAGETMVEMNHDALTRYLEVAKGEWNEWLRG